MGLARAGPSYVSSCKDYKLAVGQTGIPPSHEISISRSLDPTHSAATANGRAASNRPTRLQREAITLCPLTGNGKFNVGKALNAQIFCQGIVQLGQSRVTSGWHAQFLLPPLMNRGVDETCAEHLSDGPRFERRQHRRGAVFDVPKSHPELSRWYFIRILSNAGKVLALRTGSCPWFVSHEGISGRVLGLSSQAR